MTFAAVSQFIVWLLLCHEAGSSFSSLLPDTRPALLNRTFTSVVIDELIHTLFPLFTDNNLAVLFKNCLPSTLDTTIFSHTTNPLDTFIITGDINALWLRDSTNQVIPYLPYVAKDRSLQKLICGLIERQAESILIDPFANSFNFNVNKLMFLIRRVCVCVST